MDKTCHDCYHLVTEEDEDKTQHCDAPIPIFIEQFISAMPTSISDFFDPETDAECCASFTEEGE